MLNAGIYPMSYLKIDTLPALYKKPFTTLCIPQTFKMQYLHKWSWHCFKMLYRDMTCLMASYIKNDCI